MTLHLVTHEFLPIFVSSSPSNVCNKPKLCPASWAITLETASLGKLLAIIKIYGECISFLLFALYEWTVDATPTVVILGIQNNSRYWLF